MCAAAEAAGLEVFAITDHCEINCWEEHRLAREIPASVADIEAEKGDFSLRLLTGVELGQPLQDLPRTEALLDSQAFDFVIGSLHNTAGDPDFFFGDYAGLKDEEIRLWLGRYYAELLEMVRWGRFDTLAHITYPYRYLNAARKEREIAVDPAEFDVQADAVFRALIKGGIALELNATSIMRDERDCALNIRYFRRYRELGGELVTVGSDAHSPDRVGHGIAEACAILRETGFEKVVCYEERRPRFVQI